jgi:hypothetical protein
VIFLAKKRGISKMLGKLLNSAISLVKGGTTSVTPTPQTNQSISSDRSPTDMYPQHNDPYNPYQQVNPYYPNAGQSIEYGNPEVTYCQIRQQQEFYQQQVDGLRQSYEQRRLDNDIHAETLRQRTEYQAEMIREGAEPEYYDRLNAAYLKGINKAMPKQK